MEQFLILSTWSGDVGYWESLPLGRVFRWIGVVNRYAKNKNKK